MSARPATADAPAFRAFSGPGFSIDIPGDWTDCTVYAFRGPAIRDFEPVLCVQVEPEVPHATSAEYASARLPLAIHASSGSRLMRREPMRLGSTHQGEFAEVSWSPRKGHQFVQRLLYAVSEETGFTVSCNLSRHARAAAGRSIHEVFASFRPYGTGYRSSRVASWIGDRFRIDLPKEWKDETTLVLAEPDATRFRRNLVIRRTPEPDAPDDLRPWADIEVGILKDATKNFELVGHQETTTADEGLAQRIEFLRDTDDGDRLRQTELAAWRSGTMYVLMLTTEADPPSAIMRIIDPLLRSFAARQAGG